MKSYEAIITEICKRDKIWAYAKQTCTLGERKIEGGDQIECSGYGNTKDGPYVAVTTINGKLVGQRLDVVLDDNWKIFVRCPYKCIGISDI